MREDDAHAIAARLGSCDRTYSTEVPRFRSVGRQSEEMMPKPAKKVGLTPPDESASRKDLQRIRKRTALL